MLRTSSDMARGRGAHRFTLLMLEHGETYVEDFSAYQVPIGKEDARKSRRIEGRLKLCSRSLVFDPQDISHAVLRFPFRDCTAIGDVEGGTDGNEELLYLVCNQTIEMREDNVVAPYNFKKERVEYRFSLKYVSLTIVLSRILELRSIADLSRAAHETQLASIIGRRKELIAFDHAWLESVYEKFLFEATVDRVSPLVANPGRVVITSSRLYFQAFNNISAEPCEKFRFDAIRRIVRRRFMLRHRGAEVFLDGGACVYLNFSSTDVRDLFYDTLLAQPGVQVADEHPHNATLRWQYGRMSNFDYLLHLNSLADRSFNDLTQYPVFPWVITDYISTKLDLTNPKSYRDLSKPIGALNPQRLELFKDRYDEMPDPKFLYGTHYSTPGYVLYYLVRIAPEYMLCLQNGKFDHADRLFHSVPETWSGVLSSPADVKELIPEFYAPPGDFLLNTEGLSLGVRQDKTVVNNVALPPWARDAHDFTSKLREALESDYVSESIHAWIDLIFGCKQRGDAAVKADNLFYYLTYEGAVNIDEITNPNERKAIEVQIEEFGQTPRQLFHDAHPRRLPKSHWAEYETAAKQAALVKSHAIPEPLHSPSPSPSLAPNAAVVDAVPRASLASRASSEDVLAPVHRNWIEPWGASVAIDAVAPPQSNGWRSLVGMRTVCTLKPHREPVTAVCLSEDGENVFSVSVDTLLKVHSVADKKQIRSISPSGSPLTSCALTSDGKTVLVGSYDNHVYQYSVEYGRVLEKKQLHDDAVSALCLRGGRLVTGSWDSGVRVWDYASLFGGRRGSIVDPSADFNEHDTAVTCLAITPDGQTAASGTRSGHVVVWDLKRSRSLWNADHGSAVVALALSPCARYIAIVFEESDQTVSVLQAPGIEHITLDTGASVRSLVWDGHIMLVGDVDGCVQLWDSDTRKRLASVTGVDGEPLTCLAISPSGRFVAAGTEGGSLCVWRVA
eukprot:Opistho-2@86107